MSGGFGQFLVAAFAIATQNWWLLATTTFGAINADRQEERARRRAIQQQNDAARDRLVMVDLQPNAPRTLVMGRVRYVEGVRDVWTSGAFDENMTMVVSFAGHEIDGFEQWYLDDKLVTLDGSGWVNEAPYRRTDNEPRSTTGVLDGAGNATLTLADAPAAGTDVFAVWASGSGEGLIQGSATVTVVGTTATVTGGQALATVNVIYTTGVVKKFVRIRPYLGITGQNVGADLAAEYPGKVTATDRFAGFALAVVDVLFEPDVFPQGRPNVSAVLRGAKLYDPRTGATVFSENLALMALHYFTYAYGWARSSTLARTADIVAAANACDTSTAFVLRKPDGSTSTVTRPRFHGGITILDDADKAGAMASLVDAMGGREGWAGGQWRLRAGVLGTAVATITQDWLVNTNSGGRPDDEPVITAVQSVPRTARINRVAGRCTDPDQRYQLLPFPAVQDPVLLAAKGERLAEVEWQAVNNIAHAQHLGSMMIRRAQAGLQLELTCGEQAADLELLDVVELTMPDYGYSAKPFEVVGITWNPVGAYKLTLLETSAALYTVDAELAGRDPAPDSDLREPWDVETMGAPTVTSGTTPTLDGSIITRAVLTWTPVIGQNIRRGGQIEIQYTEAAATLPAGDWPSWAEQGDAAKATIPGLLQGRFFFFRLRAVQTLPLVRGPWSPVVLHQIATRRAPRVIRATTAPTVDVQDGDEWIDTDGGNQRHMREAGAWVAVPLGTLGASPGAFTEVVMDEYDFAGASSGTGSAVAQRTVVVTPLVDSIIEVTGHLTATNVLGDSGNFLGWRVTPAGGSVIFLSEAPVSTSGKQIIPTTNSFAAAAGVALTFQLTSSVPAFNPTIAMFKSYLRITVVKR